jgi:hypothetical protein
MAIFYRCDICKNELSASFDLGRIELNHPSDPDFLNNYKFRLPRQFEACRSCMRAVLEHIIENLTITIAKTK